MRTKLFWLDFHYLGIALAPMDDHYMGSADVNMAGEWKAKVEIAAGSQSGTAEYAFGAAQ